MTRTSKFPAKITFLFCTLFCLYSPFAFSQDVDTAWVRRYNGPGNGNDKATAIAVDSSGNVYVTGSSFDSTTSYDFCTIKYLPNGDTGWVRRYSGTAFYNADLARALVLDANGNAYVTGVSYGDITTVKYDSSGQRLWVRRLTTGANRPDSTFGGYALALDNRGNLYVTGQQWDVEYWEWFLIKYDTSGNLQWSRAVYLGYNTRFDLAVDTAGDVYAAADGDIVKYDPQGNRLWGQNFPGGLTRAIYVKDLIVYVTGGGLNITTVKYDTAGNQLWRRDYAGFLRFGTGGHDVIADESGNVYVTGAAGDVESSVWYTIKYDSSGNQLWANPCGLTGNLSTLALDTSGNIYVTGSEGYYSTFKFDPQGNQIWHKGYGSGYSEAEAIDVDVNRNVYVTGFSYGVSTGYDFATIKYSPLPQSKGDLNLDGTVSAADVVLMLNCAFLGEPPPAAPAACDLNCDGKVTPADVVVLLLMVFASAPAPC